MTEETVVLPRAIIRAMTIHLSRRYAHIAVAITCTVAAATGHTLLARQSADASAKVDAVFAKWPRDTPGCAVGVAAAGKPVLAKAYGMADLEHDVAIAPDTIGFP